MWIIALVTLKFFSTRNRDRYEVVTLSKARKEFTIPVSYSQNYI